MEHHSEAFVALDTAKLRNAVAIADAGRNGEIRYLGEFDNTEVATRKLVAQLASKYSHLTFCYEAGPTGYGLYRLIKSLGHDCMVVAPSLIPSKPGDRVKTNRRDAVNLAKLLRAGELTAVWCQTNVMRRCGISCEPATRRPKITGPSARTSPHSFCGLACIILARRLGDGRTRTGSWHSNLSIGSSALPLRRCCSLCGRPRNGSSGSSKPCARP